MAHRRQPEPPQGGRAFTAAELSRIRQLVAEPLALAEGHPNPRTLELDSIHAAAGRHRGFKMWELMADVHDPELAYLEETGQIDPLDRRFGHRWSLK
jgi:hypothetical protein